MTPTSETLFVDSREQVIMAQTGAVGAQGSEDAYEFSITGTLPIGDTTGNVTYFVIDTTTNTVVGHVVLPNAVQKETSVAVPVNVPNASASYQIGTFDEDGFHASSFLSIHNPTQGPPGAIGAG